MSRILKTIAELTVLVMLPLASAFADATLGVQPTSVSVGAGTSFAVDITIGNAQDLYAFQFDIAFTAGVLSANAVTEGAFLSTGGTTFFLPGTINNISGTISFNADTLVGSVPGVSGGGTLAVVDFVAVAAGMSPIRIVNVTAIDSTLSPMNTTTIGGVADVGGNGVPEPRTLILAGGGLLCVMRRRLATIARLWHCGRQR